MPSSRKILIGLLAGVGVGLFIGERAAVFDWVAEAFIRLLQMTVLPYVTLSIVISLGRLELAQARALMLRVGAVLVGLWAIALTFAFLIPVAFPTVTSAAFFSTSLLERREPFDLIGLYVPTNPFHALTFSIVPAVVLFSALVGIALIGIERKQTLLDVLQVAAEAVARTTRLVGRLTPYGLFAIAATTAGTLSVDQFARLQVYLVTYAAVALLLGLFILPGLVVVLTPVTWRELSREAHAPVLTAFAAGDLLIVLPSLIDASKSLLARHAGNDAAQLPDVIVPAAYNFPHTGKLLSLSFVLFAAWFADVGVSAAYYPQLAAAGLVSFFGSLNAAVPFLLDLFRIPAETFQLFVATGVINARFGTLLAAVHTLAVGILGSAAMAGMIRWNRQRALRFVGMSAIATVIVIGGARVLFATWLAPPPQAANTPAEMTLAATPTVATVLTTIEELAAPTTGETLEAIRSRGALRVGYLRDSLPYAFFNRHNDLVGFDVELAHRLAAELGVTLQFVPLRRDDMGRHLESGHCDLVMSGVVITTERASRMLFSAPYLDETLALLVPDHTRERFASWSAIDSRGAVTIGVPDLPYFVEQLHALLPRAQLQRVDSVDDVFTPKARLDAVAFPAERGSAWTLMHPQYSVVVPEGATVKVPLAYPIARDAAFASFINTWIEMKKKDGTFDRAFSHWILGQNLAPRRPRWAIARDVLHWID